MPSGSTTLVRSFNSTLARFAAVVRSGGHRPWKAMKKVTEVALQLLSLVHTLICVRIFQIFDCDKFDNGDDAKLFFLHADYSINRDLISGSRRQQRNFRRLTSQVDENDPRTAVVDLAPKSDRRLLARERAPREVMRRERS